MGRRGPAPKPVELRILQGNPGRRPLPKAENLVRDAAGSLACPKWICVEGRREWRRVARMLQRLGVYRTTDRAALAAYCQSWGRYVQVEKILREEGMTFETDKGYVGQRPEVGMSHKYLALVKSLAQELGLTPASRPRVKAEPEKDAKTDEAAKRRAFLLGTGNVGAGNTGTGRGKR